MKLQNPAFILIMLLISATLLMGWNNKALTKLTDNAIQKNGFDISNSTISTDEILSGGPPRDGIPAIDKPEFINAKQATFLQDNDRVIGVNFNGLQRAYPITIMNWHEIVNDTFANKSVSITFCPLCGTGIVYDTSNLGKSPRLGVSGLLYNSDVLLYDVKTESLWSQILSKAISGPSVNKTLKIIPSLHTSWKKWRELHSNTQVLSTKTGFHRDYSRSPYGNYDKERTTYFPVTATSKKYHPKERVVGLNINGQQKAWPFAELAKLTGTTLNDNFAGKQLTIKFDVENREAKVFDKTGTRLPSINSFWFAWYGFYPDGEVFTVK